MPRVAKQQLCGIYLIRNTVSGLCYVGQSSNIERRWISHRHMLRRQSERLLEGLSLSRRPNRKLLNSWLKHGESAFDFSILELCAESDLTKREEYWLDKLRNEPNVDIANFAGPADNPMRGSRHSKEAREKISAWSKSFVRSDTHKRRIGEAHRGREFSEETISKMRASKLGKPTPWLLGDKNPSCRPGARDMFRGANNPVHKAGVIDKIRRGNSKPIIDIDTGETWESASFAAISIGVSIAAVAYAASGKHKRCQGRRLMYVNKTGE